VKTIYLGNLPLEATEDDVRGLFGRHGTVAGVSLIRDQETGQSRGFGFVEMDPAAAAEAIEALDGTEFAGRTLRVNEARDRGARPPRRSW
jgi:RNA recognition motif-containing protein